MTDQENKVQVWLSRDNEWRKHKLVGDIVSDTHTETIVHFPDSDDIDSLNVSDEGSSVLSNGEVTEYNVDILREINSPNEVFVFGRSDDIIRVGGTISEEIYANYGEPTVLQVGDASVEVDYDGEWHVHIKDGPDVPTRHFCVTDPILDLNENDISEQMCVYSEFLFIEFEEEPTPVRKI